MEKGRAEWRTVFRRHKYSFFFIVGLRNGIAQLVENRAQFRDNNEAVQFCVLKIKLFFESV